MWEQTLREIQKIAWEHYRIRSNICDPISTKLGKNICPNLISVDFKGSCDLSRNHIFLLILHETCSEHLFLRFLWLEYHDVCPLKNMAAIRWGSFLYLAVLKPLEDTVKLVETIENV